MYNYIDYIDCFSTLLTVFKEAKVNSHILYSKEFSIRSIFDKIASTSKGNLVILCIGNIRNEWRERDWHL